MANRTGKKGNKGGAGRRNKFGIDWSQFEDFAIKLDELNADVKKVFNDVMEQVGETVQEDTVQATAKAYLPASGKYSQGDTIKAVDTSPKVEWSGTTGSINLGFDYSKPSAGGFLISGTPRMAPDYKLQDIYVNKKYAKLLTEDITQSFIDEVESHMKG